MKKLLIPSLTLLLLLTASSPGLAAWDDGVSAFQAGRYEEAADRFRAVVDGAPDAPQGHYMLGLSLLRLREPAAALEPLAKAVELQPASLDYRMALAQTQLKAGEPGAALATLAAQDPAAVTGPQRETFGQLLATAATRGGKAADALPVVAKALAADPRSKALWLARSQLDERLDRPQDSFEALVSAYELDPSDTALGQRAIQAAFTEAQAREDDARREWYRRAAAVATTLADAEPTPQHLRYAGEARMGLQDYSGALHWFERAAEVATADPLPHFYMARCALAQGDAETALGHLDAAIERSPETELTTEIWNARGSALRQLERFAKAAEAYRRAGNTVKIAEMEDLVERQKNNEAWEREKRRCEEKERTVRARLAENDFLEGTEAWRRLEKEAAEALADCRSYLNETS